MVYNGNPYWNGWFGCTTILGNLHMFQLLVLHHFLVNLHSRHKNWRQRFMVGMPWYVRLQKKLFRCDQKSPASNHNQRGQDVSQALLDRNKLLRAKVDWVDFRSWYFGSLPEKKHVDEWELWYIYIYINPGLGGNSYGMCFLSSKKVVVSGHACLLGDVLFPKGLTCCEGNEKRKSGGFGHWLGTLSIHSWGLSRLEGHRIIVSILIRFSLVWVSTFFRMKATSFHTQTFF